jgi:hypothetical protein
MCAEYTINVNATSNASGNTNDTFLQINNGTSMSAMLKRVRVSFPATTPADNEVQVSVVRNSTAGSGGSAFVALKRRQNAPTGVATIQIKNGTASFTVGTTTDTPIRASVNQRSVFEWIARDEYDYIEAVPGTLGFIAVAVQCSAASQLINAEADYEE